MSEYIMRYENDVLQLLPDKIQPLVRCKDCRKHGDIACPLWTDAVEFETDDDWFCADGERKDGDGNG